MPAGSSVKTRADHNEVHSFLRHNLGLEVVHLAPLTGGEVALAYQVETRDQALVFRLGPHLDNFKKDAAAHTRWNCKDIPIPMVTDLGTFNEKLFFALSEKVEGTRIDLIDTHGKELFKPPLLSTLSAIHLVPIPSGNTYGLWKSDAEPTFISWSEYVLHQVQTRLPQGRTFEEEARLSEWKKKCIDLCYTIPNIRALAHGDYGGNNGFAQDSKVSGVIDWAESIYGDPLYDIAWLTFWSGEEFLQEYSKTPAAKHFGLEKSDERLSCCLLMIGLGALWFFQYSGQTGAYEWTFDKLQKFVGH